MRLFDTHAHYYDDKFGPDRAQVLSALPGAGVERVVCPGCDLESSRQSLALAEQFPFLYGKIDLIQYLLLRIGMAYILQYYITHITFSQIDIYKK